MKSLSDFKQQFLKGKFFFLFVALLCLGVYFNALGGEFVSDDIQTIVENPQLDNLSFALKQFNGIAFLQGVIFYLFGRNAAAFHAFTLHILVTILVYFFVLILTKNDRLSTFTTLLFAVHPIHTEAVSWISGAPYVLCAFFFLLSFVFYHFYLSRHISECGGIPYLIGSLVVYLLGLMASGVWMAPLLAIFFLYEKYFRGKKITWVFYLILAVAIGLNFFSSFRQGIVAGKAAAGASVSGSKDPTVTIPHSLTQYLYLLFWPLNLSFYHEGLTVSLTYVFLSRIATVLLIFLLPLFLFLRKIKVPLFFLLFFLVSISLSLSPIKIAWYVAERYLYLGSISFCVLLAFLLLGLEKISRVRNLALFFLIPILLLYSIRIFVRNKDWQTRSSFWIATAEASPTSFRAHNNLGNVYGWQGNWDKAIEEFKKSLQIKSDHDAANYNLGIAYLNKGNLDGAKKHFLAAIRFNSTHYRALYNLGLISYKQEDFDEARKYWGWVLKINPDYLQARRALNTLESKGL